MYTKILLALLAVLEQLVTHKINGERWDVPLEIDIAGLTLEERLEVSRLDLLKVSEAFHLTEIDAGLVRAILQIDWPNEPLPTFTLLHLIMVAREYLQDDKQVY